MNDAEPDGLYLLFGPRRVGKSVQLKRLVLDLTENRQVPARRVIHAACDAWRADDLEAFLELLDSLAPPSEGPRYVLLDEITAIDGDWVPQVKWLRDNTALADDCVVLSGSSSERLEEARKELAGRRGKATKPDRTLLPMGFRAFCQATGVGLPDSLPTVHPRDMLGREAATSIQTLRIYLSDLVPAWECYLEVGGFPKAVADWLEDRVVSDVFQNAIWDVIHGDALKSDWAATQTQFLLEILARRIANPFNLASAARDLDVDRDALRLRLQRLSNNYLTWPCFQSDSGRPSQRAWRKHYFIDPLHARLAAERADSDVSPPDYTVLTEQQLGMTLRRVHEAEGSGSWSEHDSLMYFRSETGKEVDFTGPWLRDIPYEGKYTEGHWKQQTATAMSAFGHCIIATRSVIERDGDRLAVPAPLVALLLDPQPVELTRPGSD